MNGSVSDEHAASIFKT